MDIWQVEKATGNPLTDAYLSGDPKVRCRYEYMAADQADMVRRAAQVEAQFDHERRTKLTAALRSYAASVTGLRPGVETLLQKLADPRSVVVVTGQQAGLFTGPLYTLYKAMSTVAFARRYEALLQRPVVPVFWAATEDHDFDEVASAFFVSASGSLERAQLWERPVGRAPVGEHAVGDEELNRLMTLLATRLPDGMYKQEVLDTIYRAYHETDNMGDAFNHLLCAWLGELPILTMNPVRPELRSLVRDAFATVLHDPKRFRDAALAGAKAVRDLGYEPQVDVQPVHSLLYLVEGGRRLALNFSEDHEGSFLLRDSDITITKSELLDRLQQSPEDFSSGVLFRPVVQDHLLPVLAYVGGPAEIAYHGMAKEVFAASGRTIPPLLLRERVTVIPRNVQSALRRLEVSLEDALDRDLLPELLVRSLRPAPDEVIGRMTDAMRQTLAEANPYFTVIDPALETAMDKTSRTIEQAFVRLQFRTSTALMRQQNDVVQAAHTLSVWLRPKDTDQERVLTPLSVIAKYGSGWLSKLCDRTLCSGRHMTFVNLADTAEPGAHERGRDIHV